MKTTPTIETGQDDPAGHEAYGLRWPHPFFGYQRAGIDRLLDTPSVLLADEMGLGKTIQAVAAIRILAHRRGGSQVLIVCPVGLILQWRRQLRIWAPELSISTAIGGPGQRRAAWRRTAKIYLTGYEALHADRWRPGTDGPAQRRWDIVILDEAQRIKNPKTDASAAVKRLDRARSWALTGTPLENRLDDLISVLDFAAPGRFERRSMAAGLRRLLSDVQLRRRRNEVLPDLPPKFVATVTLDLTAPQRTAYQRAEEEGIVWLRSLGRNLQIVHILELILRLKQICNFCPESDTSTKLADLRHRLATLTAGGEKALIFSQFVEEPFGVKRLARELASWRPLSLTGGMAPAARAAIVDEFERDPSRRIMILSLRAGGLGLNLTAASAVFHFDRWWNPAVETQAEDRVHRIGQQRPVQVFAYLCGNTIEERIEAILAEKRALFADVVDGVTTGMLDRLDLETLLRAVAPDGVGLNRPL